MDADTVWMGIGFLGEGLFGMRFVIQWIATERKKRSVVPAAFWHLSVLGSALVLSYAIYLVNPVFIVASAIPLPIYLRNLYFIHKRPPAQPAA
jgi:lipid-A-disaccharide synthase-like uncharacterized protein